MPKVPQLQSCAGSNSVCDVLSAIMVILIAAHIVCPGCSPHADWPEFVSSQKALNFLDLNARSRIFSSTSTLSNSYSPCYDQQLNLSFARQSPPFPVAPSSSAPPEDTFPPRHRTSNRGAGGVRRRDGVSRAREYIGITRARCSRRSQSVGSSIFFTRWRHDLGFEDGELVDAPQLSRVFRVGQR